MLWPYSLGRQRLPLGKSRWGGGGDRRGDVQDAGAARVELSSAPSSGHPQQNKARPRVPKSRAAVTVARSVFPRMNPPLVCVKIASCLRREVQPVSKAEESQMSRMTSALPVSARLKRNCVNANEGAGASRGAIIPVTPSPSREAAPSVSILMAEGVEV